MHEHDPIRNEPINPESTQSSGSNQLPATEQRMNRSGPFWVVSFSAIALVAGSGLAWWTSSTPPHSTPPLPLVTSNVIQSAEPKHTKAPIEQSVQIYWLKTVGDKIELAPTPIVLNETQPNVILKSAFEKMLQGSADPALVSTIPANTKLQKLDIQSDGIHIDLSKEFTSGGGSTAMMGRVAQVIYTATTLNPSAPVWISVNGKALEVLGGEGLELDQPMTRQLFDENFKL